MNEFFEIVFGAYTWAQLFGFAWFFLIGYLIYGLNEASNRDKLSPRTPRNWNWKFWFRDNWRRYLTSILTTYIFFRFYVEFVGHPFTYFEALMLGLIGDGVGAQAKKKVKKVQADRKKLMQAEKIIEEQNNDVG